MAQKYQILEAIVSEPNQSVRFSDYLDKDFKYLTGMAVVDFFTFQSSLEYSAIDGKELFPRGFELVFLQANNFVRPSDRFFGLEDVEAKGKKIELEFKDGGTSPLYPFTLKVYLRLENENRKSI